MKALLSGLVTDLRGTLGNAIASKNKQGNYFKSFASPYSSTLAQSLAVRARMSAVIQQWGLLSDSSKLLWASAAPTYTFTDSLGNTYHPSGYQLFIYANMNVWPAISTFVTTPANYTSIPMGNPTLTTITLSTETFLIRDFTNLGGGLAAKFYTSQCHAAGVNINSLSFRLFATVPNGTTFPYDLYSAWLSVINGTPVVNDRVSIRVVQVQLATGIASPVYTHGLKIFA